MLTLAMLGSISGIGSSEGSACGARPLPPPVDEPRQVWLLRRMAAMMEEDTGDAAERVIDRLSRTDPSACVGSEGEISAPGRSRAGTLAIQDERSRSRSS